MSATAAHKNLFPPAKRVTGEKQDVWYVGYIKLLMVIRQLTDTKSRSIVNEAAAASPIQPILNMGQGFLLASQADYFVEYQETNFSICVSFTAATIPLNSSSKPQKMPWIE
jgi:hypothetical protein